MNSQAAFLSRALALIPSAQVKSPLYGCPPGANGGAARATLPATFDFSVFSYSAEKKSQSMYIPYEPAANPSWPSYQVTLVQPGGPDSFIDAQYSPATWIASGLLIWQTPL